MKKQLPALLLSACLLLTVPVSAVPDSTANFTRSKTYSGQFSDLTAESTFYANISALYEYGLSVGKADGSYGVKGFVTNALPETYTYFYTCGPEPMLKAVYKATSTSGQMSFEERMGCGFGACMGCSCKTITGYKRICKGGPVMKKEEILWEA